MTTSDAKALKMALKKRFAADEVEVEKVGPGGRYRFAVVSSRFNRMSQLKRQDEIWKVVDSTLSRNAILGISLILAFAPRELAAAR
jgi:acid stress-induced BolA-like protein IbaG/YrbA